MAEARWRGYQDRYFYDPFFRRFLYGRAQLEDVKLSKDKSPPEEKEAAPKLGELADKTHGPILKIETVIPLNPFPHKVIVDFQKVTIIYWYFFFSKQIHSVFVKDISDVLVETGWFFSTLKIVDVGYTENSIDVHYLSTKDAIKARKVIQGLIIAHKNNIDLSKHEFSDLCAKIEEIGEAEEGI